MSDLAQRMAKLSPAQRKLLEQRLAGQKPQAEPIAIVGMSCRFAGANSLAEYWRVIRDGVEAVSEVPPDRWDIDELYDPTGTQSGKMFTKWGGFVDRIDQFDPQFFGIAPREASRMDPQQRMLLEVAWEAMENGGIPADQLAGSKTGVYVGIGGADYSKVPSQLPNYYQQIDAHVGTGNALSIAANRISYIFDFHGPSAAVDTACSSASLAIHLAVESLRRKECNAALAGGVNAIITPETTIAFSKARMLSPEGKCRPFDAGANGYVRGEGCGLVLLKRLADAQRDGDQILAVIRATSVNQDGRTSGISAPNGQSQQECIRAAHAQAGVTAADISYVEAHGTGTPLGDPIEMQALTEIFTRTSDDDRPLHVTSVKANIGHTETVSGAAGIIKAVLLMQQEVIPPQLYFNSLNPHISLDGSRIVIPTEATPWPANGERRLAGISSFGFGGTNTHLLIEAPPAGAPAPKQEPKVERISSDKADPSLSAIPRERHLLKLSGRTSEAIEQQAQQLSTYLGEHPEVALIDVCFTANTGRADFNHRAAIACDSRESLEKALATLAAGKASPTVKRGQVKGIARPKVAFLFTGQGSQYAQMGRELYRNEPVFREAIDQCDEILRTGLSESLLSLLFPTDAEDAELVNQTVFTQPSLFAIEYATTRLWQSWGVEPGILLGHSVGEYVAATIAGCMTLPEGLGLISERARLMQQISKPGKMAVVFAPEAEVAKRLAGKEDKVAIAAVNGPENTVISGDADAVDALVDEFESSGVGLQRLVVSHAFHSPLMDEMLDTFEEFAAGIDFKPPTIPLVSNLTGQVMTEAPTARYWRDHVRGAVRFVDGVERVAEAKASVLLEVGPTASLLGMAKRCLTDYTAASIASLRKGQDADQALATAVGEMYTAGVWINWRARSGHLATERLMLPNYPFNRDRFWFDVAGAGTGGAIRRATGGHPLLGGRVPTVWTNAVYETVVDAHTPSYLVDHQVQGSVVVPAAAFIEQGLAAASATFGDGQHGIRDVSVQAAMFLPEEGARLAQITVEPEAGGCSEMESYSTPADADSPEWQLHATATLLAESQLPAADTLAAIDLDAVRERVIDLKTRDEFYQIVAERGLVYGPQFQVLGKVDRTASEALAPIEAHEAVVAELAKYRLHPVLGDACLQTLASTVPLEEDGTYSPYTYMPVAVAAVRVLEPITSLDKPIYCYAVRRSEDASPSPETVTSDVYLVDETGRVLVEMQGAKVQRIGRGAAAAATHEPTDWLYSLEWKDAPLAASSAPAEGTWLVFGDAGSIGLDVAKSLAGDKRRVVLVRPGDECQFVAEDNSLLMVTLDPLDEMHYTKMLEHVTEGGHRIAGVVHLWSLDIPTPAGEADWQTSTKLGVGSVLGTIKQLARSGQTKMPRLWLATAGAQAAGNSAVNVAQAPLVGFTRVAAVEHPELAPTLVDLEPEHLDAAQLVAELGGDSTDSQVAYRGGKRLVARLAPDTKSREAVAASQAAVGELKPGGAFQLRITSPGSFDALKYLPVERKAPAAGEVELAVHATGLNFSDVLKALGLYPGIKDEIVPLGIECSGVVTAIGEGVTQFKVGDEVMGVAPYAFASHATTRDYTLVHKPKNISHDEASTIPIVFLTAHYGLVRLAGLEAGERVLIHAGAGGVGLAAIQICQHLGAEVYATAGSDEKRDYLRSLGVKHVYSSRTLDFAEQILADTNREGVDVVLNSLPGEAITKSLSILRAYGRFLEIGKTDIYQNRKIGLLPFQDNLSYFAIDLDRMLRQRPNYIRGLYDEVMPFFEKGIYQPELFTRFELDGTIDAFRYMSQRKNIGKVVVAVADSVTGDDDTAAATPPEQSLIHGDGSYLITGGLGGLGLQVAHWLADKGAGGLVLMSRRAPSDTQQAAIAALEAKGTAVHHLQGDVVDYAALTQGLAALPKTLPPLRGVIHAAGVLADGVLADMSVEQLNRAMLPKTLGAWNLHLATADTPLDLFVLFSSVAAMIGSPGQSNYAAGNATLDALAHYRRSQNLPATSINWGPWAGSGMAADTFADTDREAGIKSRGMDLLPVDEGLQLLGDLVTTGTTQTTVMDVYWDSLLTLLGSRRLSALDDMADEHGSGESAGSAVDHDFRNELFDAPVENRVPMVRDYIQAELARIMSFDPDQLDVDQPLTAFGLDSLMALELKNNLEARLAFTLPMAKLLEGPSIASLAGDTVGLILGDQATDTEVVVAGDWKPLVKLRDGALAEPLVLLPALGGDVGCYHDLVQKLTIDRPVLAFRPRGMDDANPPHTEMHQMAADYAQAIVDLQPNGPHYIAGWSAGGVTAFAVAEALVKAGREVKMLALFDSPLPSIYRNIDVDDEVRFLIDMIRFTNRFAGTNIQVSVGESDDLSPDERFAAALAQAREQGMFPPSVSDEYVHRLVAVGSGLIQASQGYKPEPLDLNMHLYLPTIAGGLEDITEHDLPDDNGWQSLVGQTTEQTTITGDHFTMMTDTGAKELAGHLDRLLK